MKSNVNVSLLVDSNLKREATEMGRYQDRSSDIKIVYAGGNLAACPDRLCLCLSIGSSAWTRLSDYPDEIIPRPLGLTGVFPADNLLNNFQRCQTEGSKPPNRLFNL